MSLALSFYSIICNYKYINHDSQPAWHLVKIYFITYSRFVNIGKISGQLNLLNFFYTSSTLTTKTIPFRAIVLIISITSLFQACTPQNQFLSNHDLKHSHHLKSESIPELKIQNLCLCNQKLIRLTTTDRKMMIKMAQRH